MGYAETQSRRKRIQINRFRVRYVNKYTKIRQHYHRPYDFSQNESAPQLEIFESVPSGSVDELDPEDPPRR